MTEPESASRATTIKAFVLLAFMVGGPAAIFAFVVAWRGGAPEYDKDNPRIADQINMMQIESAVERYQARMTEAGFGPRLPVTLDELLVGPPDWPGEWQPVADRIPLDPWGNAYGWRIVDAAAGRYEIRAYGQDGQPGGAPPLDHDILERSTPRR